MVPSHTVCFIDHWPSSLNIACFCAAMSVSFLSSLYDVFSTVLMIRPYGLTEGAHVNMTESAHVNM